MATATIILFDSEITCPLRGKKVELPLVTEIMNPNRDKIHVTVVNDHGVDISDLFNFNLIHKNNQVKSLELINNKDMENPNIKGGKRCVVKVTITRVEASMAEVATRATTPIQQTVETDEERRLKTLFASMLGGKK